MKITNAELKYMYLVKVSKCRDNTINGWVKEVSNPHRCNSARIAVKKMIEFGGLRWYASRKDCKNKAHDYYEKNDSAIRRFFDKHPYFDLLFRIIDEMTTSSWDLIPEIKKDELNLLK